MGKKKAKKQTDEAIAPQPSAARNYQIPGVDVHLGSSVDGIPVDQFLAIAFNIASANPGAKVAFGITIKDPDGD